MVSVVNGEATGRIEASFGMAVEDVGLAPLCDLVEGVDSDWRAKRQREEERKMIS